ncbi:MAG: DUF1697 domain-containing protein [Pseudomonadota bacterium]
MTRYVAFLRAVNVGGTGKLPMAELRTMCAEIGFADVQTYIASGNVVFESGQSKSAVKAKLKKRLEEYAGKPVGVTVRTATEIRAVLNESPFPGKDPKRTVAIFLDGKLPPDATADVQGQADEEIVPGTREIYVHYPSGMGRSKLKIPAAKEGTARNMNTVEKMVELTSRA